MTDYLPQAYPLWCAEVHEDGEITVGRVVGWETGTFGVYPLVAFEHPGGLLSAMSVADPDHTLFLAGSREAVEGFARRHTLTDGVPDPLDHAMFTVWLEGNWKWVTKKMTTEAREAAVAAVLRYDAAMKADDPGQELLDRSSLAWWD